VVEWRGCDYDVNRGTLWLHGLNSEDRFTEPVQLGFRKPSFVSIQPMTGKASFDIGGPEALGALHHQAKHEKSIVTTFKNPDLSFINVVVCEGISVAVSEDLSNDAEFLYLGRTMYGNVARAVSPDEANLRLRALGESDWHVRYMSSSLNCEIVLQASVAGASYLVAVKCPWVVRLPFRLEQVRVSVQEQADADIPAQLTQLPQFDVIIGPKILFFVHRSPSMGRLAAFWVLAPSFWAGSVFKCHVV
jgi:hypothetical protein